MVATQIKGDPLKKLMKEVNKMIIPSTNNNYINTIKKDELNGLSPNLFLDKINRVKQKEHGYIRHYVTKLDGERVKIKETKLPKGQDTGQSAARCPMF